MPYYAVRVGRNPGVYDNWPACNNEVKGYYGAQFKKFITYEEALKFIDKKELSSSVDELQIYTDGSFNNGISSWAAVYVKNDQKIKEESGLVNGKYSNNTGELTAILKAVESVNDSESVTILSDSEYAVKSLTIWIQGWEKNGWRTSNGQEVKNQHILRPIYEQLKVKPNIKLVHIRGHNGNKWNETADRLAGDEISRQKLQPTAKVETPKSNWWAMTDGMGEEVDDM